MKQQAFIYKLLGSGWLTFGLICLALIGFQLGGMDWSRHVERALSGAAAVLWQTFYHPLTTLVLPVWGALCIVLGWHLVRLVNWAQQLGQAMHLLLAIYLVAALIVGFNVAPESQGFLALGILLLAADLGLAYPLRGRLASEAFSHLPLRTAPIVSRRCEFCGGALDVRTGRCVECQPAVQADALSADAERARPALVVQLVSLDDGAVYALSAQQPTLVGRELACNDINLTNPTVSRQHARIEYDVQNSHYLLIAMQDTNGTFVNDKLVRQRILRDGDQVRFGRARFHFQVVSGMENSGEQRRIIP
jgi:hypothetical protein